MKEWLVKYRHLAVLALFGVIGLAYFLLSATPPQYIIHVPMDDAIPFIPAFILPYVLWYLYVPLLLLAVGIADKRAFYKQCAVFFFGALVCILVFFCFPTGIDFRPTAEGNGLFLWICRLVFANDYPCNVCPSLHCYEAVMVHLTAFSLPALHKHTGWRIVSVLFAVLICLSTVFVKQHSVVDAACGVALALLLYALFYGLPCLFRKKAAEDGK